MCSFRLCEAVQHVAFVQWDTEVLQMKVDINRSYILSEHVAFRFLGNSISAFIFKSLTKIVVI